MSFHDRLRIPLRASPTRDPSSPDNSSRKSKMNQNIRLNIAPKEVERARSYSQSFSVSNTPKVKAVRKSFGNSPLLDSPTAVSSGSSSPYLECSSPRRISITSTMNGRHTLLGSSPLMGRLLFEDSSPTNSSSSSFSNTPSVNNNIKDTGFFSNFEKKNISMVTSMPLRKLKFVKYDQNEPTNGTELKEKSYPSFIQESYKFNDLKLDTCTNQFKVSNENEELIKDFIDDIHHLKEREGFNTSILDISVTKEYLSEGKLTTIEEELLESINSILFPNVKNIVENPNNFMVASGSVVLELPHRIPRLKLIMQLYHTDTLNALLLLLTSWCTGYKVRRWYKKLRRSAVIIQRWWRRKRNNNQ